jgi:hypothetical protein
MNESLQQQAFRELAGQACVCGGAKERGQSFCRDCYFALPKETRTALYRREGYANTWDDAIEWLRVNTTRLRK